MGTNQKVLWGSAVAVISAFIYAWYSTLAKMLSENGASFFEMTFFSFFIGWLCLLPFAIKRGVSHLKTARIGMHFLRSLFGLSFLAALVASLKTIPMVDAVMLNNSAPLFMPFIARYWLGCAQSRWTWLSLFLGLAGVACILKPDEGVFSAGALLALLSGILMAFSWSSVRKLSMNEPVFRIVFYYFFFASILAAIPLFFIPSTLSLDTILPFAGLGLLFMGTTLLMTYASTLISIVAVSILYYSLILFSGILNWVFWNQIPDAVTLLGFALVIGGGFASILIERHRKKKECL